MTRRKNYIRQKLTYGVQMKLNVQIFSAFRAPAVDLICKIKLPKTFFKLVHQRNTKYKSLTLSTIDTSQPGCSRSSLTISARPCSLAHIKAVDPSSSCTLTSAPHSSSTRTISCRPWLTASINAVWPACKHNELCHFFLQHVSFIE